jgi:hypothetical protein
MRGSPNDSPIFVSRGSQRYHSSIFLLQPLTPAANFWIDEHLPEDRLTFAGAVVVEHRYIADIVRGAIIDALVIK